MVVLLFLNRLGRSSIQFHARKVSTQNRSIIMRLLSTGGKKTPQVEVKKETGGQLQRSILEEVLIHEKKKPTTFTGKVAEKASNTLLYAAVAGAVALLGAFAYYLGREFFAEDSPQKIFTNALKLVRQDGRCQDLFGETIAGFGEETSRGRRRHVAHHKYEKDGRQRIRIMFHLKGERDEGIGQAEMEQRDGEWEWRFLYVETKRRPKTTHVLIDNRMADQGDDTPHVSPDSDSTPKISPRDPNDPTSSSDSSQDSQDSVTQPSSSGVSTDKDSPEVNVVDVSQPSTSAATSSQRKDDEGWEQQKVRKGKRHRSRYVNSPTKHYHLMHSTLYVPKDKITKVLDDLANSPAIIEMSDFVIQKIDKYLEDIDMTGNLSRIIVLGNGHFHTKTDSGAHQFAFARRLQEKYDVFMLFQEPIITFTETEWLQDQEKIIIRKQGNLCIPQPDDSGVDLVIMIHGEHSFLNEFIRFRYMTYLQKTLFICNLYKDMHYIGGSRETSKQFEALTNFRDAAEEVPLPRYAPNAIHFSDTGLMWIPDGSMNRLNPLSDIQPTYNIV